MHMIVRKLRLKKGWSQDQLATLTGLNIRTIQRIERGQSPSLESQKALAAVFEVGLETFQSEAFETTNQEDLKVQNTTQTIDSEEKLALQYAKSITEFYTHLMMFLIFIPVILITKGVSDPQTWMICGGWTLGVIFHGLVAYEKITLFTPNWERKIAEKKLGRKLK